MNKKAICLDSVVEYTYVISYCLDEFFLRVFPFIGHDDLGRGGKDVKAVEFL